MSVNSVPTCPAGCSAILPDLDFNYCSPVNSFGEITHIFLAAYDAECFTDWTSAVEWLNRLDNDTDDPDAIRFLHTLADKPVAERETIETSLGRKVKSPGAFTISLDVDDVSSLNYEFMRQTGGCSTLYKMWYIAGDFLFGGTCGIDAIINLDYQIERGTKTIHKIVGTATWEAAFAPERCTNPLAGQILTDI